MMNCKQFCSPLTTCKTGFLDIKKVKVKLRDSNLNTYLPVCDANDFNSIFSINLAWPCLKIVPFQKCAKIMIEVLYFEIQD